MSSSHTTSIAATATVPDRLLFCADALTSRGALVEPDEAGAVALLPAELAEELGVPDTLSLVASASKSTGALSVEFGSPLLERLVDGAKARPRAATTGLDREPPRPAQARALAERFAVRNGVQALIDITAGRAVYSSIWVGWTAESDDRHEGLLHIVLSEHDGGEPDCTFTQTLSPHLPHRLTPVDLGPVDAVRATAVAQRVGARTRRAVTAAVAPIVESADRRRRRDHERMTTYFMDLAWEARAQGKRRSVDDASLAEKLRHFAAERDAKLAELGARFAVRVTSTPLALLRVEVPVLFVRVRVRRRKEEREIVLCLPAGASSLDRPSCDGCACSSSAVAMCDDRLHVLCTDCAPSAQGRIPCPRCRQER